MLYLNLPAWPGDRDVQFKLLAPQNTIITGDLRNGEIEHLEINQKKT